MRILRMLAISRHSSIPMIHAFILSCLSCSPHNGPKEVSKIPKSYFHLLERSSWLDALDSIEWDRPSKELKKRGFPELSCSIGGVSVLDRSPMNSDYFITIWIRYEACARASEIATLPFALGPISAIPVPAASTGSGQIVHSSDSMEPYISTAPQLEIQPGVAQGVGKLLLFVGRRWDPDERYNRACGIPDADISMRCCGERPWRLRMSSVQDVCVASAVTVKARLPKALFAKYWKHLYVIDQVLTLPGDCEGIPVACKVDGVLLLNAVRERVPRGTRMEGDQLHD